MTLKILGAVTMLFSSGCAFLQIDGERQPASQVSRTVQSKVTCSSIVSTVNEEGIMQEILGQKTFQPEWTDEVSVGNPGVVTSRKMEFFIPEQKMQTTLIMNGGIVQNLSLKVDGKAGAATDSNSQRASVEYRDPEGLLYRTDCEARSTL